MKYGLLARIQAKPEFADQVEDLLRSAESLARQEEPTITWYAFREDATTFGIFDTFDDEAGRTAHLEGQIATALMQVADTMLADAPDIRSIDLLAAKSV